ncbi:MAG: NTPase [Candidatus Methanomethylicia archaeon]
MKRIWLLTGRPGIGKTTAIFRIVDALRGRNVSVGGVISLEIREGNVRVGFKLIDVRTGREGILAHVNFSIGPQVGKYRVNLEDLRSIAAQSILDAINSSSVIVCDEIGPMELYSREFREAVLKAIESGKIFIGTIHYRVRDKLVDYVKSLNETMVIELTFSNRDEVPKAIVNQVLSMLEL